jgi:hypothetical protein
MIGFNATPSAAPAFNAQPVAPQPPTFIQQLVEFCATATKDRDASHGCEHSK